VQVSPSSQLEISSPRIQNSFFSGEGRAPGLPAKLARTALAKGLR